MRRMRDFYMEVTFQFESSVIPFIGRIAPSDTYKIWKRGSNLRADMTLAGFDSFRIRCDQSFFFLQITQVYGFYDECQRKYRNANTWRFCTDVFDYLTLSAIIDRRVLCVHGGLSPDIRAIDQIRVIDRHCEIPHEGPFCDLMWSDPEDIDTWAVSPRGAGWLFGCRVTSEFNHINDLELVCRAHQLVQEGLKYMFEDRSLVTVWSAPNYCYRCGNVASILSFNENMERDVKFFTKTEERGIQAYAGHSCMLEDSL